MTVYEGERLRRIRFPLGGIGGPTLWLEGTGLFALHENRSAGRAGGRVPPEAARPQDGRQDGAHNEHEHENRGPPVGFLAVSVGGQARVLRASLLPDDLGGDGSGEDVRAKLLGLPGFAEMSFESRFPVAVLRFADPDFPVDLALRAWSPFVPGAAAASSAPAAVFDVEVTCCEPGPVALYVFPPSGVAVAAPLAPVGSSWPPPRPLFADLAAAWRAVLGQGEAPGAAQVVLQAPDPEPEPTRIVLRLSDGFGLPDEPKPLLRPLSDDFGLPEKPKHPLSEESTPAAAPAASAAPAGGEGGPVDPAAAAAVDRSELFTSAFAARLAARLASAALPPPAREAVAHTLAVLRSPTVTRALPFDAYEGWLPTGGSCGGTCLHVWAYAAPALGDLFPAMERSAIDQALARMRDDGAVPFREGGDAPAADGQMALVVRAFRTSLGGAPLADVAPPSARDGLAWLRPRWPAVRRALAYAWTCWDADRDGVMEGVQHCTYDVDLHGPNPLTAGWYLGALRAAAAMATALGEPDFAATCTDLATRGAAWVDAHLWNGRFYVQQIRPHPDPQTHPAPFGNPPSGRPPAARPSLPVPSLQFPAGPPDEPLRYQLGGGCLADQLAGAWFAKVAGLGDVLDPDHTLTALRSIVAHNFRDDLKDHHHAQRVFAVAGEGGLVNCTWPDGGRPDFPIGFCDEVWTGVEYQVAAHLRMFGETALSDHLVAAARARYDGARRDPFADVECGRSYARSLSAWTLLA